jgi:hypothetical protein
LFLLISIEVGRTTQADLRKVAKNLRATGKGATREMTKALRDAVKPVERDVKAAARGLPAKGPDSTGLRAQIAKATGTQVRTTGRSAGVKVRVAKKRMGGERIITKGGRTRLVGDQKNLPQRMNRGQWRHPVYGTDRWVTQRFAKPHWFDNVNRAAAPMVRRRVKKVLDDIEKKLAKS